MRNDKKITVLLLVLLAATVAMSMSTLRSQSKQNRDSDKAVDNVKNQHDNRKAKLEAQFPIVDYDGPDLGNSENDAKRRNKNKRYDKRMRVSKNPALHITESASVHEGEIQAIPASQSDLIVIGEVLDSVAHLSNDKGNIYTELSFRVEEILKCNAQTPPLPGSTIIVERLGGFVRYPNGHKQLYRVVGQGMPRIGRRYILFLDSIDEGQDFSLLTGYELGETNVSAIDSLVQFLVYEGKANAAFLNAVRNAIAQDQQSAP